MEEVIQALLQISVVEKKSNEISNNKAMHLTAQCITWRPLTAQRRPRAQRGLLITQPKSLEYYLQRTASIQQ